MIQPSEHQHHTIWTPELVEISLPLAGIGRRCLAMVIDQLVVMVVLILLWILFFSGAFAAFTTVGDQMGIPFAVGLILVLLLTIFSYTLYFWGFHTFNHGKTLGKLCVGIRLVTDRGGRANGWTCFIRALFDMVDWMLFSGGVAVIMILASEREKRIADFAAGTIVIWDR